MANVEKVASSAASGSSGGDTFQRNELQKPLQSSNMDKENQEKFQKPVSYKIIVLGESGVGKSKHNFTNNVILDLLKLFMLILMILKGSLKKFGLAHIYMSEEL